MAKVLLVEDVPLVRQSVRAILEADGHSVVETADGSEGLAALKAHTFDLVVADIWMPNTDGIALLKEIKAGPAPLPVIIISGGGPKASLEISSSLAQTWGADTVLYKPFEDHELIDAVNRILAG